MTEYAFPSIYLVVIKIKHGNNRVKILEDRLMRKNSDFVSDIWVQTQKMWCKFDCHEMMKSLWFKINLYLQRSVFWKLTRLAATTTIWVARGAKVKGIFLPTSSNCSRRSFNRSTWMPAFAIRRASSSSAAVSLPLPFKNEGILSSTCRGFKSSLTVKPWSASTTSLGRLSSPIPSALRAILANVQDTLSPFYTHHNSSALY